MRISLYIILLLIISLAESKTIHADVTDDGINDKIIMGLKSVVVVNKLECCKRNRHTLVSDTEYLVDIMVNDFHHGIRGKEIAIVMLPGSNCVTEIYGFRNNQFKKALFVDKKFALAYFNLALLLQTYGDKNEALRGYKNAIKCFRQIPAVEPLKFSSGFTVKTLMETCQRNVRRLQKE